MADKTITPLNTYIIVAYEEPNEKKTESGLYVPNSVDNNAFGFLRQGKVQAINPTCEHIAVGDSVWFNKNAKTNVPNDNTKILVRTEDVYAVIAQ